jgi:hypothetical protein
VKNRHHIRRWAGVLAVALIVVGILTIGPGTGGDAAAAGGPTHIMNCASPANANATVPDTGGAPDTGPETAWAQSDGSSQTPLWCVSGISGESAPDTASGSCGGTTGAAAITYASRGGFDWVC